MRHLLLTSVYILLVELLYAQPFQVGHRQQTFTDPSRANRQITCEVYYPASTAGNNTPVAAGQFPILVFGHGFVMTWSAYDVFWLNLVPQGYIMVFPTTESSLSPSHLDFGKDIAFLCNAMKAEGQNSASPYFGAVDSRCAAMGHSMGGGAAFLAMQEDTSITVLATFAAAVTSPSSVAAAQQIQKPAIVFAGANDCVTPPVNHQLPMYDSLASSCKTYISVTGGSHCQFASFNFNCYLGEGTCTPQPAITATVQQNTVFNLLLPWLNYYLKNDCPDGTQFQNLVNTGSGITSLQNCSLNCTTGFAEDASKNKTFLVYPNPSSAEIHVVTDNKAAATTYMICNYTGQTVKSGVLHPDQTIDIRSLSSGMYLLILESGVKATFTVVHEE
ncbi:MAG: hypothetical protein Fur0041_09920 [Bacteroidia bacterium]